MITYETYCKIIQMHKDQLRPSQIAASLGLNEQTVRYWLDEGCYRQRKTAQHHSKLDSYKPQIVTWLEKHPYSAQQVFQKLQELGYQGGITILRDYVQTSVKRSN